MTMTLTEFLLARIAEDEAWAVKVDTYLEPHAYIDITLSRTEDGITTSEHVPAITPARVAAECEAKRAIIAEHEASRFAEDETCGACMGRDFPCKTLRILTLPYVDHPDYLFRWAP